MKKKELLFISGILLLAAALWLGMKITRKGNSPAIRITIDGEEYGTYSLSENQVIAIRDTNVCEIKDGKARMTEADCPDHLCMKQRAVDASGGSIICLPNRVVIEALGQDSPMDNRPGVDSVA